MLLSYSGLAHGGVTKTMAFPMTRSMERGLSIWRRSCIVAASALTESNTWRAKVIVAVLAEPIKDIHLYGVCNLTLHILFFRPLIRVRAEMWAPGSHHL